MMVMMTIMMNDNYNDGDVMKTIMMNDNDGDVMMGMMTIMMVITDDNDE